MIRARLSVTRKDGSAFEDHLHGGPNKRAAAGDIAERGIQYTKEQWDEIVAETEDHVRADPTRSILYAAAAGFTLDRLPISVLSARSPPSPEGVEPAILVDGDQATPESASGRLGRHSPPGFPRLTTARNFPWNDQRVKRL